MLNNLFCENSKCQKPLKKDPYQCTKCFNKKFCSTICIQLHGRDFHDKLSSKDLIIVNNKIEERLISNSSYISNKDDNIFENNYQPELEVFSSEDEKDFENENEQIKSIFIKPGIYLNTIKNSEKYNFSNFDLRRDQPLGKGSFGDVFLGIHKKTGEKYAFKQVKNNF